MAKYQKMRDLLSAALNEAITRGEIDLDSVDNVSGVFFFDLFGKPSRFSWRGINHGELTITIWWGVRGSSTNTTSLINRPLVKSLKKDLDLCCSAWLERKTGKWIQGQGKRSLIDCYCSNEAFNDLKGIPEIEPMGFEKEGRFFI